MSSEVQAKCTNSSRGCQAACVPSFCLIRYSTALTSWLVSRSIALTVAASAGVESVGDLLGRREVGRREPAHLDDAAFAGQRLQPGDLDADPGADQALLAEDLPELGATRGVAAIDGGERGQRGETHAVIREVLRSRMIPHGPASSACAVPGAHHGRHRLPRRTRQHGRDPRARRGAVGRPDAARGPELSRSAASPMPRGFIRALGLVKWAAAGANLELGDLDRVRASRSSAPRSRSPTAGTTRSSRSTCSRPAPAPAAT